MDELQKFFKEATFEEGLMLVAHRDLEKHADWRETLESLKGLPQQAWDTASGAWGGLDDDQKSLAKWLGAGAGLGAGYGAYRAARQPKDRRNYAGNSLGGAAVGAAGGGLGYGISQTAPRVLETITQDKVPEAPPEGYQSWWQREPEDGYNRGAAMTAGGGVAGALGAPAAIRATAKTPVGRWLPRGAASQIISGNPAGDMQQSVADLASGIDAANRRLIDAGRTPANTNAADIIARGGGETYARDTDALLRRADRPAHQQARLDRVRNTLDARVMDLQQRLGNTAREAVSATNRAQALAQQARDANLAGSTNEATRLFGEAAAEHARAERLRASVPALRSEVVNAKLQHGRSTAMQPRATGAQGAQRAWYNPRRYVGSQPARGPAVRPQQSMAQQNMIQHGWRHLPAKARWGSRGAGGLLGMLGVGYGTDLLGRGLYHLRNRGD